MKVLLLVPNLTVASGGVGNIYKVIKLPEHGNVEYFYVNAARNLYKPFTLLLLLWKYLSFSIKLLTTRYDVVHINPSLNAKSFYRDGMFIRIAKLLNTPVLTFFHGWEDPLEAKIKQPGSHRKWFMHTFAQSDKFIVLGQIFKDKLMAMGVSPAKEFFIETTVADDSFLDRLNLPEKLASFDKEIKVLFISRMVKEKGIYIAIEAFEKVRRNTNRKLQLLVAGSGPELQRSKDFVAEKGIEDIVFLGFVTGNEKGKALVNSHILLFPTYYGEGLPCTVLEGMLYGMPVISRINAGIPDVIINHVNGYITDSLDPEVFAGYLKDIINNRDQYHKMALANHQMAKDNFISAKVRDRILKTYQTFT